MEAFNKILGVLTPVTVLGAGLFFALLLRGLPLVRARLCARSMTRTDTGASSFKSLTLALAGTLGVGNIVGVSSAIAFGGFGSVFWMWASALAAMFLKYAEVTLAMRHRQRLSDGGFRGGAPYYIRDRLSRRAPRFAAVAAVIFAVFCMANAILMGCVIQANTASAAAEESFGIPPAVTGFALALLCFLFSVRGRRAVTAVTSILVPLMSGLFLLVSLAAILRQASAVPSAFGLIFQNAFRADSAAGGIFGFLLSRGIRFGTIRGLISNEAGCGTSPTAHAASDAKSPVEQGFFGIIEVFVDTILLCTVTALVIILRFDEVSSLAASPMAMTLAAYSAPFGAAGGFIRALLSSAVLCFGLATMLCWGHYGTESLGFILRTARKKEREAAHEGTPSLVFLMIFCGFALWGAHAAPALVWSLTDLITGVMTLMNTGSLLLSRKEIRNVTLSYFGRSTVRGSRRP